MKLLLLFFLFFSAFLCVELDCLDRDAKALQEKAAKKAGQAASGGSGDAGGKSTKK